MSLPEDTVQELEPVVKDLSRIAAERALVALETKARLNGVALHIFPAAFDGEPDCLTVTYLGEDSYRYWMKLTPNAGPVERQMAVKMLATDKAIRAMEDVK